MPGFTVVCLDVDYYINENIKKMAESQNGSIS